jgi:lipid II:glycine glycyltransferase (peptidoglycan interpeptide bridge formation enzyme)
MISSTPSEWQEFIARHPQAHILQSEEWGRLKSAFGWVPKYLVHQDAGVLILFKKLPLGFSVGYIPKGPIGTNWMQLWPEIDRLCKEQRCIFLKLEPDLAEIDSSMLPMGKHGFFPVERTIQPRQSITINLEGTEEDWLGRMKQKTRYNIRLAQKKDIIVEPSMDIAEFHALMQTTGNRDGFGVHSQNYYQTAYDIFHSIGKCELLVARYQGKALAALMLFWRGERSWYLYGASSDEERNRMPAYALQWEAMRWAANQGCKEYDLWGIPDEDETTLEAGFLERYDGLWGVYRFKRGYGGNIIRTAGALDRVYIPALYRLYQFWSRRREI